MALALAEARRALDHGDVPDRRRRRCATATVIAARHNERELTGDPTAHAEILALRDAAARRRPLAARRLHARRHARAVRDVRRRRRQRPHRAPRVRRHRPQGRRRRQPLRRPRRRAGSTTARRSRPACGPTSAAICCARSSPSPAPRNRARPGRMPERTNGTASKAVEVLRASVGSNPTPSASAHRAQQSVRIPARPRRTTAATSCLRGRRRAGRGLDGDRRMDKGVGPHRRVRSWSCAQPSREPPAAWFSSCQ